jgi:hypothetical protein
MNHAPSKVWASNMTFRAIGLRQSIRSARGAEAMKLVGMIARARRIFQRSAERSRRNPTSTQPYQNWANFVRPNCYSNTRHVSSPALY